MSLSRYNTTQYISSNNQYGNSNIEKYLKNEIDFLLAPSVGQLNGVNFDEVYISMPNAEQFLSHALNNSKSDMVMYFTGLAGSGKTMILKKVFQYHGMTPEIKNNTLVIPFSFDNFANGASSKSDEDINKGIENVYENMLSCACEEIENNYPNLKFVSGNEEDFLKNVKSSRGDFTQVSGTWPRPTIEERMKNFMINNAIPFHTSIIKYYLNQKKCPINNIVILVDDIEGAGERSELIPIKIAYRIITCLENTQRQKNWSIHLVISCRNYVYRLIMDDSFTVERQQIETYTESEKWHLENAPSISNIVNKRYLAISQKDKNTKWKTALDVVMTILNNIDSSIGDFILNLKIRNLRKALSLAKRLIYNKQWIQRDYPDISSGAFKIDSVNDYDITPATLIRAIGMGESKVYYSNDSDIPNVLYNEDSRDLYQLLVIKYCLQKKSHKYATWYDTINIDSFYNNVTEIFGNSENPHMSHFKSATEYLILHRLLLRSIDQLQDNTIPVNEENVSEITKVYISNAAVDIWDLLSKNSVLFEMYTDDIWMDNSSRSTSKKQFRGFDSENYEMAINYMNVLVQKETIIRNHAKNLSKFDKYSVLFGKDTICDHLLNGLLNSLNAFYKKEAIEKKSMERINKLRNQIKNI